MFLSRGDRDLGVADATIPVGGKVYFECDGAMSYAMLYCDGKFLGGWPYGYTRWRIDLTKAMSEGEHVIAIRCHNVPHSSRWYTGGGAAGRETRPGGGGAAFT